jgi:hypothetical protein
MPNKQVLFALFACTSSVLAQGGDTAVQSGVALFAAISSCKAKQIDATCNIGKYIGTCQKLKVSDAYLIYRSCYMNY